MIWQLPLGCLGTQEPPFSQGVLSQFRARMVEHERTVRLPKETGKFGWQHLKFALDSSPLLGAGRVEDTWNLIGRALSTVVDCAGKCLGVSREHILKEARLTCCLGRASRPAWTSTGTMRPRRRTRSRGYWAKSRACSVGCLGTPPTSRKSRPFRTSSRTPRGVVPPSNAASPLPQPTNPSTRQSTLCSTKPNSTERPRPHGQHPFAGGTPPRASSPKKNQGGPTRAPRARPRRTCPGQSHCRPGAPCSLQRHPSERA
jgi:hypothetical protein